VSVLGEVGGTVAELPGFGLESFEDLTPFDGALKAAAKASHTKTPGQSLKKAGSSAGTKAGDNAQQKAEQAVGGAENLALKVLVNGMLILVGVFLIAYGIMVAVRPRESAFSVPVPA
jgi:hypothetical protein